MSKVRSAWGLPPPGDGYAFTPVPPEVWIVFERAELPPADRLILIALLRAVRFDDARRFVKVGLPDLVRLTGFSKPHVSKSLARLDGRLLDQVVTPGRKRTVSLRRLLHHAARVTIEADRSTGETRQQRKPRPPGNT